MVQDAGDYGNQRGLSTPRGADQHQQFAQANLEVHAPQGLHLRRAGDKVFRYPAAGNGYGRLRLHPDLSLEDDGRFQLHHFSYADQGRKDADQEDG